MNAPFWISLGTNLACFCIMAGCCFDVERLVKRINQLEDDHEWFRADLAKVKRPTPTRRTDDTGPIPAQSRPVPTTVTGIPSARPEVPRTGSTVSEAPSTPASIGPRHRATKKKVS